MKQRHFDQNPQLSPKARAKRWRRWERARQQNTEANQKSEIAIVGQVFHQWFWRPRNRQYDVLVGGFSDRNLAVKDAIRNGYGRVEGEDGKVLARS